MKFTLNHKIPMTVSIEVDVSKYPRLDADKMLQHMLEVPNFVSNMAVLMEYYVETSPDRLN